MESDFSKIHKVVLLDDTAVLTLFPDESPVGKTIEIMGEPFTVIGVIKKPIRSSRSSIPGGLLYVQSGILSAGADAGCLLADRIPV